MFLSSLWSIYLVCVLMKEFRIHKNAYKSRLLKPEAEWQLERRNYKIKQVKRILLLFMCLYECGVIIAANAMGNVFKDHSDGYLQHLYITSEHMYIVLKFLIISIDMRVHTTVLFIAVLLLLIQIRILTEYMRDSYEFFYKRTILLRKYCYFFVAVAMIAITGFINPLILFQRVLLQVVMITELILILRARSKLIKLLYKRYFDAKFHEHDPSAARYFKIVHLEFKIASGILATSLILVYITILINSCFPVAYMFIFNPKWINIVYGTEIGMNWKFDPNSQNFQIFMCFFTAFEKLTLMLGGLIMLIPYCIVSVKFLVTKIKKIIRFRRHGCYTDPKLIKKLLENNYNSSRHNPIWQRY